MVCRYIMFWAKTSPEPDATTDFGVMLPWMDATSCRWRFQDGRRGRAGRGEAEGEAAPRGEVAGEPAPTVGTAGLVLSPTLEPLALPVSKTPDRHSTRATETRTR